MDLDADTVPGTESEVTSDVLMDSDLKQIHPSIHYPQANLLQRQSLKQFLMNLSRMKLKILRKPKSSGYPEHGK